MNFTLDLTPRRTKKTAPPAMTPADVFAVEEPTEPGGQAGGPVLACATSPDHPWALEHPGVWWPGAGWWAATELTGALDDLPRDVTAVPMRWSGLTWDAVHARTDADRTRVLVTGPSGPVLHLSLPVPTLRRQVGFVLGCLAMASGLGDRTPVDLLRPSDDVVDCFAGLPWAQGWTLPRDLLPARVWQQLAL